MTARGSGGTSLAVSVLVTVLAVAGAITLAVRLPGHAGAMADAGASARAPRPAAARARTTAAPSTSASASPYARRHHHARPRPDPSTPSPSPASPSAVPAKATPVNQAPAPGLSAAAQQVLALINQARSQSGLAAYTVSSGLDISAARHTSVMAAGCGLSHQCPGEPGLGARETAAGVHWTAAGENIGEGGPVPDSAAAIAQMAVGLTQSMLDEKPPDDGHRLNILSSAFTHTGISVYRDSSGTVWMTQDFSN